MCDPGGGSGEKGQHRIKVVNLITVTSSNDKGLQVEMLYKIDSLALPRLKEEQHKCAHIYSQATERAL